MDSAVHADGDARVSITWSTAAQGARVVPILLIHGVGVVIVPEGVSITGITVSPAPAGWWPGVTYADFSSYLRQWFSLADGFSISERAVPSAAQVLDVSEVTIHLSDVDLATTVLLASQDNAVATYITAEVLATDVTVNVVSTTGFASSGVFYLGQEAIAYSGKTGTTFTGCTRGYFGSKAARHVYSVAQGSGLGNPQATDIPVEVVGLPATLWLAQVTSAGVITALALEHYGTIGTGPALTGGGEDTTDGWTITVDHAIKRMGQVIRGSGVSVGGYAHPGNLSARTTKITPSSVDMNPLWVVAQNGTTLAVTNLAVLTGDAAAPDLGGWHPTRESFVNALSTAISSTFGGTCGATLAGDELRISIDGLSPGRLITIQSPSCQQRIANSGGTVSAYTALLHTMSKAWVPIFTESRVYLTASDYATVPTIPTLDADAAATNTSAYFALIFGDDGDPVSRKVARIVGQVSSSGVNYLICTALTTERVRLIGFFNSASSAPPPTWRGGTYATGFVVSEPTTARLGLYVASDTWVSALKYVCQSLDIEYACIYDAIDWDHMASVANAYPSVIDTRREYIVDLNTTLLSMLQNEAALNGFTLVMHEGRVSIARVAEFAVTEPTSDSITTNDLDASAPSPAFEKGVDGIVNTYTVHAVDAGVTVNITDETSRARFGGQRSIVATMPRTLMGTAQDVSRLYAQVFAQGVTVLGPLRYPYQHVTVRVPLNRYGLQIGDLVDVTLWRIPNGRGGRGITGEVAQIVGRELTLYESEDTGHVAYVLRLNPRNLQGYAPSALVAAGGIAGAVVTLDTTTLTHDGASIGGNFAGAGYTDGGASTFAVGDLVRLMEIDSTSPTASTQHTVSAVSGSTISLSPSPSATFATLAASALKVMVLYDTWTTIAAGGNATTQEPYAYLADTVNLLDSTHPARTFAA